MLKIISVVEISLKSRNHEISLFFLEVVKKVFGIKTKTSYLVRPFLKKLVCFYTFFIEPYFLVFKKVVFLLQIHETSAKRHSFPRVSAKKIRIYTPKSAILYDKTAFYVQKDGHVGTHANFHTILFQKV
jgi:hypothetical protein